MSPVTRRIPAIPEPNAVPRLILAVNELGWVAIAGDAVRLAQQVDGVRSVRELAAACGFELETAQLIVADLCDRHVVAV
jgi:hypothetical protein